MADVKRSKQTLLTRRERAKVTHWRIVKAAYEAFCEQGYAGTTMVDVAERAGSPSRPSTSCSTPKVCSSVARSPTRSWGSRTREFPRSRRGIERPLRPQIGHGPPRFRHGDGEIIRRVAPLVPALPAPKVTPNRRHRLVPRGMAGRRIPRGPRRAVDQGEPPRRPDAGASHAPPAALRRSRLIPVARPYLRLDARRVGRLDRPGHRRPGYSASTTLASDA